MIRQWREWLHGALGWFVFPVVPVLLANAYQDFMDPRTDGYGCPDPYQWDRLTWVAVIGPLLGFGFLAGATLDLPDDPAARGWRSWLSRRALWVAVVPWSGLFAWRLLELAPRVFPQLEKIPVYVWNELANPAKDLVLAAYLLFVAMLLGYTWLVPGLAALWRARRRGRLRPALQRGAAVMVAFVGSLFGTFWAITKACSGYFFDRTLIPVALALLTVTALSGCAGTITYGEVRRRELFQALLVAWVFGLAILWRWWSRPRRK